MYKVTLSKGYMDINFVFVSIEAAGRFIETALDAASEGIRFTVVLYQPEKAEESEVSENESISD